jgi:hypothetical protein
MSSIAKKLLAEIHSLEVEITPYDFDMARLIREKNYLYNLAIEKENKLKKFFFDSYKNNLLAL